MNTVCLASLIEELESGSRPKGGIKEGVGEVVSVGAEHLSDTGGFNFKNTKRIPQAYYELMTHGRISPSDILVVKDGATTGKVSFVDSEFPFNDAAINEHVFRIKVDERKTIPAYIYRYLQSSHGKSAILSDFRGATVGGISRGFVNRIELPLPPLHEQRRVAMILDKADAVRQKRKEVIKLTETFLRAAFIDMFGDPLSNPNGFLIKSIRSLVTDVKYGTSKKANATTGIYPVLRMNNITYSGEWNLTDLKYMDLNEADIEKHTVQKGDLLFNRTNSKELVGKTAVFKEDTIMAYAGYLIRCRFDKERAHPEYISAVLNSDYGKSKLSHMCKKIVGMANINAQELQNIAVPAPPIELQNKYASIVSHVVKTKQKMQLNLDETNNNFNALMQRFFG